jgi:catechol 2,3-dioxygenase
VPEPLRPEPLRISSVALAVRDLERVAAFYRDVIGLQVLARTGDAVSLGAGGAAFLDLVRRPDALPDDPAGAGLYHTAFLLPSRADLGRWLAHFGELRLPLDGAADHSVSEAVYISDPEGNGVEVYADRPRAAWHWTDGPEGRRVEMVNRPLDAAGLLREAGGARWAGAPDGTRIGHVHLRVGDLAAAEDFYHGTIGLDPTRRRNGASFLSSGHYHHHLGMNVWQSAGAGRRDEAATGLAWFSLDVETPDLLAAQQERLRQAAANVTALSNGIEAVDPWGTRVRLIKI